MLGRKTYLEPNGKFGFCSSQAGGDLLAGAMMQKAREQIGLSCNSKSQASPSQQKRYCSSW